MIYYSSSFHNDIHIYKIIILGRQLRMLQDSSLLRVWRRRRKLEEQTNGANSESPTSLCFYFCVNPTPRKERA